jgi:hypothetical protein
MKRTEAGSIGLLFNPGDGGDMFLRNRGLPPKYTTLTVQAIVGCVVFSFYGESSGYHY